MNSNAQRVIARQFGPYAGFAPDCPLSDLLLWRVMSRVPGYLAELHDVLKLEVPNVKR